jgi:hypothetical protein
MPKTLTVPPKPQPANLPATGNEWISRTESLPQDVPPANEKPVRLTFDISEDLHQRIKIACARRGIKRMSVELRRILEQHFPPTP